MLLRQRASKYLTPAHNFEWGSFVPPICYTTSMTTPDEVLAFWFDEAGPQKWFSADEQFDRTIRDRFLDTYHAAARGETASWRTTPEGRLAEVIVLDQFGRNIFRGNALAFAQDQHALTLAQEAVAAGADTALPAHMRHFLYMPYMHSEDRKPHRIAWWLFLKSGNWGALWYELKHKRIIDRFGRYPHRNAILGRTSTSEEIDFLKDNPGF